MAFMRMHKLIWVLLLWAATTGGLRATALDDYIHTADTNFAWRVLETQHHDGATVTQLGFISQRWQARLWTNFLWIIEPPKLRHPDVAALFIADDQGKNHLDEATAAAQRAGAWAVIVSRVPNQPLFDGRYADAIIAYTFAQYLQTGDGSWPLLLPMVKCAVRAMDLTQTWLGQQHRPAPQKFVVTGGSKRGWTTWLTAAVDDRVTAIAPRVFDTLNLKAQTDWAYQVYGAQSASIHDYTEAGIIDKMNTPEMARLAAIVDPFSYRDRLTLPKLILIGANDPFWTVDATRHYFPDLTGPKMIYDLPNAGHGLGRDSNQAFATFFQLIADGAALPELHWQMVGHQTPAVKATFNAPATRARLWTATAPTRDFRPAKWTSRELPVTAEARELSAGVSQPATGYLAFMLELTFATAAGDFKLSTQVQVTPDETK